MTKDELLDLLGKGRAKTVAWIRALKPEDFDKPITHERIKFFAPTWAALAVAMPAHVTMHIGQIQVIRRKLGKPVLF